jgi:hypothetical protein
MMSSVAKVTSAHACHATSAETSDATAAEATHVTSAEAAHVASAKAAAHMAAATTTSVSTASASAAAGLCISSKKATGKHCACQNHHHSSSHDILLWDGREFRDRSLSDAGVSQEGKRQRRDGPKMGMLACRLY